MYVEENNLYISKKYKVLFDLNLFRIFCITDKIYHYFEDKNSVSIEELDENELTVLNDILMNNVQEESEEIILEALKIHVSNTCNLRCKYCYAQGGNYGEEDSLMDMQTAEDVVNFIRTSKKAKKLEYISFFGGEPLMNPKVIEFICEKTCDRGITYLLQTNGTICNDDIIRMLKKYNIMLTVSLDGPEDMNDYNRVDGNGRGTYQKIVKNIRLFQENGVLIKGLEATISDRFISQYTKTQIADFLYDTTGVKVITVAYDTNAKKEETESEIARNVTDFFSRCIDGKYILADDASRILNIFLSKHCNPYTCGAGNRILAIDSKGNIYPCHMFVGKEKWKLGEVKDLDRECYLSRDKKLVSNRCKACSAKTTCNSCLAKKIKDSRCNKNRIYQEAVFEILAEYIFENKFEELYKNFDSLG